MKEYTFNPTAGIPLASFNYEKPVDTYKITWFSTIGPEQAGYEQDASSK